MQSGNVLPQVLRGCCSWSIGLRRTAPAPSRRLRPGTLRSEVAVCFQIGIARLVAGRSSVGCSMDRASWLGCCCSTRLSLGGVGATSKCWFLKYSYWGERLAVLPHAAPHVLPQASHSIQSAILFGPGEPPGGKSPRSGGVFRLYRTI